MSSSRATRPGASSSPRISWSNGASSASARATLASSCSRRAASSVGVDLGHGLGQRRAVDARRSRPV